jgi:hypothetical protein
MTEPKTFAWTPGQGAYAHFPPYLNIRANANGTLTVTVRGREQPDAEFYTMGDTAIIELPPEVAAELSDFFASLAKQEKAQ